MTVFVQAISPALSKRHM